MTAVNEEVRSHLLRLLSTDGSWILWGALMLVTRQEPGVTDEHIDWWNVALREAIALGDIERRQHPQGVEVRLTPQGIKRGAVERVLRGDE